MRGSGVSPAGRMLEGRYPSLVAEIVNRQSQLFQVVRATRPSRRLAGHLYGRQQQGHQDPDDGDHHQEFHQGKTWSSERMCLLHLKGPF